MARPDLDPNAEERLLRGGVTPANAPAGYGEVAELFLQLRPTTARLQGEAETVAMLVDTIRANPAPQNATQRRSSRPLLNRCKVAAAGLAGVLSLTTGLAAANALPSSVQNAASEVLGDVGVNVPHHGHGGGDRPATSGSTHKPSTTPATPDAHPDNKGADISDLAHTTDATGVDKGAAISDTASDGKSQAGEHGGRGDSPTTTAPPTSVPNAGQSQNDHGRSPSTEDPNSHGNTNAGAANSQGSPPTSNPRRP